MKKQESLNINQLLLLDSQNKIKDRVKKEVIIYVGDEHFAQANQILEKYQLIFGVVRDQESGLNSIIIHWAVQM